MTNASVDIEHQSIMKERMKREKENDKIIFSSLLVRIQKKQITIYIASTQEAGSSISFDRCIL
jgi:hypothetical protein